MTDDDAMDARLAGLRRVGGDRLIADLIDLFIETVPRRLEAMRAGTAAGDAAAVAFTAHSLTSSAGNLGAGAMQALAADLERRGVAGDAAALPALMSRLDDAWRWTRDALDARRKAIPS